MKLWLRCSPRFTPAPHISILSFLVGLAAFSKIIADQFKDRRKGFFLLSIIFEHQPRRASTLSSLKQEKEVIHSKTRAEEIEKKEKKNVVWKGRFKFI